METGRLLGAEEAGALACCFKWEHPKKIKKIIKVIFTNKILTQSYPKVPTTLTQAIAPPQKLTRSFIENHRVRIE